MGRLAVVTGASAGIGRAIADRLHAEGWSVVGVSRRGTSPGTWQARVMDVDDDSSVTDGMTSIIAEHGGIDAVVACAGWGLAGPVELTTIAEAKQQVETNFWGAVRTVQAVLPTMRAQGSGRVVLISSIGGILGIPFQAFYSASKFALEGFGEAMAYEVAPFGVHVTLVEPGNVRTEFTESRRLAIPPDGSDPDGADPYGAATARAVEKMAVDEAAGVPAADVAAVVHRVLAASRPPRRASVGKLGERVGIVGKRLLPYRVFEAAARGSLGV